MEVTKLGENLSVKQLQQVQLLKDNKKLEELKVTLLKLQEDEQKLKSLNDVLMEKQRNLQTLLEKSLADEIKEEWILENKLGKVNHKSDQQGNLDILCKMGYCITEYMITQAEAYEILKKCVAEIHKRLIINLPKFNVAVVDDQGVHNLEPVTGKDLEQLQ
uniref:Uncharacterized protein n=1 Tax=Glossina pallidipes TaxID=7398 RepID=A0A1B0AGG0_GLOPL